MAMLGTVSIQCPYCGEMIQIVVDCSESGQDYVEDCEVCCRPIAITVRLAGSGPPFVRALREDD